VRKTKLDRIAAQIHTVLKRATKDVIEIGKLLIKSRALQEHGEWQSWLAKNFDLTYRTAHNYVAAAEYVARKGKSETISHFANLSPTVLYELAGGDYDEQGGKGHPRREPQGPRRSNLRRGDLQQARVAARRCQPRK
jgi:hypothetical protein